jgi:hypothetical protein
MAQVNCRLTKVNPDDPIIRVNDSVENLGRHSLPPLKQNLVPRFDNKIRVKPSNEAKVTKVEDILAYTS